MRTSDLFGARRCFGVASDDGWRAKQARNIRALREQHGLDVTVHDYVGARLTAYVNDGRWIADCSCGAGVVLDLGFAIGRCLECGAVYDVEKHVALPATWKAIERALVKRPQPANRNWQAPETVADLQRENREHGIKDEDES